MAQDKLYRVDNVKWQSFLKNKAGVLDVFPLCPDHHLSLKNENMHLGSNGQFYNCSAAASNLLSCPEDQKKFIIPRSYEEECDYVVQKILSFGREKMETFDIDGMLTPVAKSEKIKTDTDYSIKAQIMKSKRNDQVVIYAGKKGSKNTQVFITPAEKRMSFDGKDTHPNDVFAEIKVKFIDGSSITMKSSDNKNKS